MMENNVQVTRITRQERLNELKLHIREVGFWNLPRQKDLAAKYGVTFQMIAKDLNKIVKSFDPSQIHEVFTEFYHADMKAMRELRKIILTGDSDEKIKAIDSMGRLQKSFTELLENFNKKAKVADRIDSRNINMNMSEVPLTELLNAIRSGEGLGPGEYKESIEEAHPEACNDDPQADDEEEEQIETPLTDEEKVKEMMKDDT